MGVTLADLMDDDFEVVAMVVKLAFCKVDGKVAL